MNSLICKVFVFIFLCIWNIILRSRKKLYSYFHFMVSFRKWIFLRKLAFRILKKIISNVFFFYNITMVQYFWQSVSFYHKKMLLFFITYMWIPTERIFMLDELWFFSVTSSLNWSFFIHIVYAIWFDRV